MLHLLSEALKAAAVRGLLSQSDRIVAWTMTRGSEVFLAKLTGNATTIFSSEQMWSSPRNSVARAVLPFEMHEYIATFAYVGYPKP